MDIYAGISNAFVRLDEKSVKNLVNEALRFKDTSPEKIVQTLESGMQTVGEMYENGQYFIADLIMSSIIFTEIMRIPQIENSISDPYVKKLSGTILIGSVYSDKHDIGKGLFKQIASASGIKIIDLGVDVPAEKFSEAVAEYKPDIVCLSALLTSAIKNIKQTIDFFEKEGQRDSIKILIAGNPLSKKVCEYVSADAFTKNITDGLNICMNWLA